MQASGALTFIESIVLGIIQGITEFLPVSSDGHLVLGRALLNYHRELLVFDVLLHLGTLGSLLVVFHKDVRVLLLDSWNIFTNLLKAKAPNLKDPKQKWTIYIIITTGVTGLLGLIFEDVVQETFADTKVAFIGFLITSAFLFVGSYRSSGKKLATDIGISFPIIIGVAQSLALLPGVSRSGSTIAVALIYSLTRREAGTYSFVAAIPIIFLASIYQARHLFSGEHENLVIMGAGVLASFLVGVAAIRFLLWMLQKQSLYPFAIYTGLLGLLGLIFF